MKQLLCELCGSNDIIKQNGLFVCQCCGAKYSLEEAKALMTSNTGNNNIYIEELLDRAEKLMNITEFSRAKKLYDEVVEKAPEDPRGWWGLFVSYSRNFANPFLCKNKYLENAVRLSSDHGREYYNYMNNIFYKFKSYIGNDAFNTSLLSSDDFKKFVRDFANLDFVSQGLINAEKANSYKIKDVCNVLGCKWSQKQNSSWGKRVLTINKFELINGYSIIINYSNVDYNGRYYSSIGITNADMCINGDFDSIIGNCRKKGLFG